MARGGKRPGAGRKPGSVNKRHSVLPSKLSVHGLSPIDLMLKAAEELAIKEDWSGVALVASRLAPYVHPKMPVISQQGARHNAQRLADEQFALPLHHDEEAPTKPDDFAGLLN